MYNNKKLIEFEGKVNKQTLEFFADMFNELTYICTSAMMYWKVINNLIVLDVIKYNYRITFGITMDNRFWMRDYEVDTLFNLFYKDIKTLCEEINKQFENIKPYDYIKINKKG